MLKDNQRRAEQLAKQKQIDDQRYSEEQRRKAAIESDAIRNAADLERKRQNLLREQQAFREEMQRRENNQEPARGTAEWFDKHCQWIDEQVCSNNGSCIGSPRQVCN